MKFIKLSFIIIVCIGVVYAVVMCQDLFKSKPDNSDNGPMPSHMTDITEDEDDIIEDEDPIAKQLEEYQRMLEKEDVTFEQINEMRKWADLKAGNKAIDDSGIQKTLTAYCDIIQTINVNSPKLKAGELKIAFNKHKDLIKPVHAKFIRQVFEIDGKLVSTDQETAIDARLEENRQNGTQYNAFCDLPSAKDAEAMKKMSQKNQSDATRRMPRLSGRDWDGETGSVR